MLMMIFGLSLESPRPVKVNADMPLHSKGEAVEEVAFDSGRALLRQVEASSSRAAMNVSSPTGDRGKTVAEDGDESGSNIDLYYLIMIDEGLTQHEVRLEGGSRTITIPMDRDLLVSTEEVVPSLGPLYSDIEGETLKEINDSTLLKSITDLALTISTIVVRPSFNALACFKFRPLSFDL